NGVSLLLNPSSMVIGSNTVNTSMSLNIQCSSSGTLDVDTLFLLKLSRRKFTEPIYFGIAFMKFDGVAKLDPTALLDNQIRSSNITGSVDTGKKSGTMTLSLSTQGLACGDQAEFQCTFTYLDTNENIQTVSHIKNFTIITVPSEVIIDSPELYDISGNSLQLNNNSILPAGTRLKYRCTANIGSVPEGELIWERSLHIGSMNTFITYDPTRSTDIVQGSSQQDGCLYRRISTMYYNLTQLDVNGISFRCRARTYFGSQLYEALSNKQYRAVT
ncbi:hypothetical protein ACJMK2_026888, partial [Sinanodonta woodiana]